MSFFTRVKRSIRRDPPHASATRARSTASNLLLHIHPPRVSVASLRFTYTFGLGGLAVLLLAVLVITGGLLLFVYVPSPEGAYRSIVALQTEVAYGQLIRNLHHWSGNLLLVVAFLHMLRVFYTAAFRTPREFNWLLGLALLGLAAFANFTGYLLPWDQLAYWAATVANSLIEHIPLLGGAISRLLLGGEEIGVATLRNFYALHVVVIPLSMLAVGLFHIWRVRKDRFTLPRRIGESLLARPRTVPTLPHLVSRELVFALVALALLLTWATWADAPLEGAADPNKPPNPTKAAWYFVGVQELLFHFHPTFGAFVIPALVLGALVVLPYLRDDADVTGIWFRSWRGRGLALLSLLLGVSTTAGMVWLSETRLYLPEALPFLPTVISNGLLPLGIILLALYGYARLLRRLGADPGEVRLALFTLLLAAFLTLTVIGVVFRGEDMRLLIPWEGAP